ncbi:MAG: glycoside hydrolase [Candidatus Omnitrophica bacterium]|nr:glycoside hydrolase [Candidatus Omnitrophota bacterium]
MFVKSIRRITDDAYHNAFTGACFFKGSLYVAYRQGAAHADPTGKIIVLRSDDDGKHFEIVAAFRKKCDARDAYLYTDGKRLFVVGFEAGDEISAFAAHTENGRNWSQWTEMTGTDNFILWRPQFYNGRYFCAAYGEFKSETSSTVAWFESDDGINWEKKYVIHKGKDIPTECYLDFKKDGTAVMIMRCDDKSRRPYLCTSKPPYRKWEMKRLDIPLEGPALWLIEDDIWISGRWFLHPDIAHLAVFKIIKNKPELRIVLPSGPGFDISYMGVAKDPENPARCILSYYSGHTAPDDPDIDQFSHPDIYLVDALFKLDTRDFIMDWMVSDVQNISLKQASLPDINDKDLKWKKIRGYTEDDFKKMYIPALAIGFVDAKKIIKHRAGVIFFSTTADLGPADSAKLYLGYDGPVVVWFNEKKVFSGHGTNPAIADQTKVIVKPQHGTNTITIALDTNNGRAQGIFCRIKPEL